MTPTKLILGVLLGACGTLSSTDRDDDVDGDGADEELTRCGAPAKLGRGVKPDRVLYVDPAAAPFGSGGEDWPFQSLEEAFPHLGPGDALRLRPGVYPGDQLISQLEGFPVEPIWIGGEPGKPKPIIAGGDVGLRLSKSRYVVLHDLEVKGQKQVGIRIDDGDAFDDEMAATNIAVLRVHVHDVTETYNSDCLRSLGVRDLQVYDSRFERCGAGGAGVQMIGTHRAVVARNAFDGAMMSAVTAKGGSTDVDIRDNRIRTSGPRPISLGGATGLSQFRPRLSQTEPNAEARDIRAFNNVITGVLSNGAPLTFVGCVDCLAAHNYVRGQQRFHVRIVQETVSRERFVFEPASRGRVYANTFVFQSGYLTDAVNSGPNAAPETFSFGYNLWYASDRPERSTPVLPVEETGGVIGEPSGYGDMMPDDPMAPIESTLSKDAIEATTKVPRLAEVEGTANGECRSSPTTIGPYEPIAP
jgi:hypothetical protein